MWVKNMQGCKINVLQCHTEQTFHYKIISQNQCDTASEIFSRPIFKKKKVIKRLIEREKLRNYICNEVYFIFYLMLKRYVIFVTVIMILYN